MTTLPVQDPELRWLRETYRPNERQLTVRAAFAGMLIGSVMCLSNLYVFLKTGWSLGVTLTACILAFAVFQVLRAVRITRTDFGVLENNAMGSVASAAGFMTGGGNMAAFGALVMLTHDRPPALMMVIWFALIAALGVFAAIPIKRQLINIEALAFPTGTATAETLRSMHASGERAHQARLLGWAGLGGAVLAWLRDAKAAFMPFNVPAHFAPPVGWWGSTASQWTMGFEGSLILMGGGALMSFRTGWSLLLGAISLYCFIAPPLVASGVIKAVSYKGIVAFSLWPGAAILVSSGLVSFAFQWRSVVRSVSGLVALIRPGASEPKDDPMADVECPGWWFPAGFLLLSPFVIWLMNSLFGIPLWAGVIAIPLAVVMGVVASRVTGETDVTPTKALGPVTQALYGALLPGQLTANIMSGNVTGGVGLHAADLLTDLKSGFLLGAKPRQQLFAQLFGVVAGSLAVVPAFNLLVPTADVLGSAQFPAPSIMVWAGVSKVMVHGLSGLPREAQVASLIGLGLGTALAFAERFAPARFRERIPSPAGLGVAFVMPGYNAVSMFLGAFVAQMLRRTRPAAAERYVVPVSSGFIAGESLMGILVAMLIAFGVLTK